MLLFEHKEGKRIANLISEIVLIVIGPFPPIIFFFLVSFAESCQDS